MTTLTLPTASRAVSVPERRPGGGLPPAGPVWFPSVMGTGILATLLGQRSAEVTGLQIAAVALLCLGWALLLGLSATFAIRTRRDRSVLYASVTSSAVPMWGAVSMGLLSTGAATLTVAPLLHPALTDAALLVDALLWSVGTLVGLATAFGFAALLIRQSVGQPSAVWGLPVVPPMVSATTAAALVPHLESPLGRITLLAVAAGCFFLSLVLGAVVFGVAYYHHWRVDPIPIAASATAWIPLGIVGQSMAANQALAAQSQEFLSPAGVPAVQSLAHAYGYAMLAVSIPVVGYAVLVTVRGFRARMPFAPGWWALTFPLGTLSLGSHLLARSTGHLLIEVVSDATLVTLMGTWTLCAVATGINVWSHRQVRCGGDQVTRLRRSPRPSW